MKRYWKFALLLLVPLGLYAFIAERNSWRPKTIEVPSFVTPRHLRFSPDGRTLAFEDITESKKDVLICDVVTQRMVARIESAEAPLFLRQGEYISVLCPSEKAPDSELRTKIFSVPDGKFVAVGPRFYLPVNVLSDGKTMIGWMQDYKHYGKLFRWDSRSKNAPIQCFSLPALPPHKRTRYFWLLADTATVIDRYDETKNAQHRTLHCWDVSTQRLLFKVLERGGNLMKSGSSPNGLFAFFNGDRVEVWNCKTGRLQSSLSTSLLWLSGENTPPSAFDKLELSPDGSQIAGSIYGDYVGLWNTKTGKAIRYLPVKHRDVRSLAFSPDGRTLASCGDDGTVKLWRIK